VHCNSCLGVNKATGIETYYYKDDPSLKALASAIHSAVCSATGMRDIKATTANFKVLRDLDGTGIPAILLECGYLNHDSDRAKLLSEDYRKKLISGIIAGFKSYIEGN
jgi:N-acetylmuramoyl-L-alanine amidase